MAVCSFWRSVGTRPNSASGRARDVGRAGASRAITIATAIATIAAATTRTAVNGPPSSGTDSNTASIPSSGVAMRNATAADVDTPRFTRLSYSGTTPQEQIGSGKPSAMPDALWRSRDPRLSHSSLPGATNPWTSPAIR